MTMTSRYHLHSSSFKIVPLNRVTRVEIRRTLIPPKKMRRVMIYFV